ncbi:hypothetical protein [Streptomyces sp. NPDC098781]|uniref:hypothetical protein n=1 Tax=Streptomyces sp. NPDC098781 TaxID=3366097 RepID=UPI003830B7A9
MTTSPPPVTEPDPSALVCGGDRVGPCAVCHRKTHRYGRGGAPLCHWCMARAQAEWGPNVRYVGMRA